MSNQNPQRPRRSGPSLFGPIVLISVGAYFLLRNLGFEMVPELNIFAALQLWPLLLIFLGVNVLVRQAPGGLGSFLSGVVGLTAVLVFGYVLLFADDNPLLERFGVQTEQSARTEEVSYPDDGVDEAEIIIDFGSPASTIGTLNDSSNLIEGELSVIGTLIFEGTTENNGSARINLDERINQPFFFFGNGSDLMGVRDPWTIELSPDVPLDLDFDLGSGAMEADLSSLQLSKLEIDGGSGGAVVRVPEGSYEIIYGVGSGQTELTLSNNGQFDVDIDGGSGSFVLNLPTTLNARIEVEDGSGRFDLPDRFALVDGDENGDGTWESPNFDPDANNVLLLNVDVGSGSVTIEQPQGR